MSDLTAAEVERTIAELERLPTSAAHPYWVWQWVKATAGWLQHSARVWSPAKGAMLVTGMMVVFVTVLVVLEEWGKVLLLGVVYVFFVGVLVMFAMLDSERRR